MTSEPVGVRIIPGCYAVRRQEVANEATVRKTRQLRLRQRARLGAQLAMIALGAVEDRQNEDVLVT